MREIQTEDQQQLRAFYRHFAAVEASGVSPLYAEWAEGLAGDDGVVELLMQLPAAKRQPNLVFAAARVHGAPLTGWPDARAHLVLHWEAISQTILRRRTQTNEAGRIAVLNCAFSRIAEDTGAPLALIEVGASAGLGLYPDAWPITYTRDDAEDLQLKPRGALTAEVELSCRSEGMEPPSGLPQVGWRAGIDLNPLDLADPEDRQWLEALVWPGMEYRLQRLAAGAKLIQQEPPQLYAGDLNQMLEEVLSQVPAGTVPVVFHSAVLVYLSGEERARFVELVQRAGVRWVSNEPLARTGPHGQYLRALVA